MATCDGDGGLLEKGEERKKEERSEEEDDVGAVVVVDKGWLQRREEGETSSTFSFFSSFVSDGIPVSYHAGVPRKEEEEEEEEREEVEEETNDDKDEEEEEEEVGGVDRPSEKAHVCRHHSFCEEDGSEANDDDEEDNDGRPASTCVWGLSLTPLFSLALRFTSSSSSSSFLISIDPNGNACASWGSSLFGVCRGGTGGAAIAVVLLFLLSPSSSSSSTSFFFWGEGCESSWRSSAWPWRHLLHESFRSRSLSRGEGRIKRAVGVASTVWEG